MFEHFKFLHCVEPVGIMDEISRIEFIKVIAKLSHKGNKYVRKKHL